MSDNLSRRTCVTRKKKCSRVMEFRFIQVLFCYMHFGMYFCDTDCSLGPASANSMLSLKYPQEGMFIVSCWSLREACPVCLERCMLVDECLSSFFFTCFFLLFFRVFLYFIWEIFYIPFSFLPCHTY